MTIKKGFLKSFNAVDYTATVQISGSQRAYLDEVLVARNLPADEIILGRNVAVIFFDEHNAREAVVVGVWT